MTTAFEVFKSCKVTDVKTVAEFLDRYFRKDRYTGRGKEHAALILARHEEGFELWDVDWISRHDSVTGKVVSFYGPEVCES